MVLALASMALLLAGCIATTRSQEAIPSTHTPDQSAELLIFAAASLTDAFDALSNTFADQNPDVKIAVNFAGSQQLAQQLVQGAPADVFASANETQMQRVINSGRVAPEQATPFARNQLTIVMPADNPAEISSISDLAKPGIKLIVAAEEVPVGRYTQQLLANASRSADLEPTFADDVLANVVSYEQSVRAVLSKIQLGEADAGIVYSSDSAGKGANEVASVEIPTPLNQVAIYPIAPIADSDNPALADAFIAFVLSPQGQSILADHGLQPVVDPNR